MWVLLFFIGATSSQEVLYSESNFDGLVFSQHWPKTTCTQWQDANGEHKCTLPSHNQWTVHGVWPSRIGSDGPYYCNRSMTFNGDKLGTLMPQLDDFWTNVEQGTPHYSFWKHEWDKHGTCTVNKVQHVVDEVSYFAKGLALAREYSIADILQRALIVPNPNGYDVADIYTALRRGLKRNPIVQCVVEPHTKRVLLSEVRLCLDTDLAMIDCDLYRSDDVQVSGSYGILTNCDPKKSVVYVDEVPRPDEYTRIEAHNAYMRRLYTIFNILKFLSWISM